MKPTTYTLEEIIGMDRKPFLHYDVYVEVRSNVDHYHVVLPGDTRGKELDLGNTQRFLSMGLIYDVITKYKNDNPHATVDELKMAVVYYWNNSAYLRK